MGVYFAISSLIILIIFALRYFSKERVKNNETKIYSSLLVLTIFGLSLEVFTWAWYNLGFNIDVIGYHFFSKLTVSYYLVWSVLFFNYLVNICNYSEKKQKIINIVLPILFVIDLLLPIDFVKINNSIAPNGLALYFVYLVCLVVSFIDIVLVIKYHKKIVRSKFMPLYVLLFLGGLNFVIGVLYPQLFLLGYVYSIIIIIMYFTIENPDVKILREIIKNRELTEKSLEDRSTTLLTLSQRIRMPLGQIKDNLNNYKKSDDENVKKELFDDVVQNINELNFIVNDILNISNVDVSKIKLVNNEYSSERFFKDIKKKAEISLKDKDIEFSFKIKKAFPPKLYGDDVKIKQILMTFINQAIKNTKEGFIDIEVDNIVRYDVLRLLFEIKTSDEGLSLEEINELLKYDLDLTEKDFEKLDSLDVDLTLAIKMARFLGGSVNIKSSKGKGSIYSIVIDQKIKLEQSKLEKKLLKTNSVLILDDKMEEVKKISEIFSEKNIEVIKCLSGDELLSRIDNKEKCNLILLEDEMKNEKAYMVLKKLQSKKVKTPVVVMLNKDKESIMQNYIDEGFIDIVKKDKIEMEINRIIDKYM